MRSFGISCGIYERIFSRENFEGALVEAAKDKTERRTVRNAFVVKDEIYKMICEKNFALGNYSHKRIRDTPSLKVRDITIPPFVCDQIWHHMVMRVLYPYLSEGFYRYNCASRPGMGTLYAFQHLRDIVYEHPDWHYDIQLDVVHFYESIDHERLMGMLRRKFRDGRVIAILKEMIDTTEKGLPLGCYYSQILANFYLDGLDHYVKEELGVPGFVRYADNMVLVGPDRRVLAQAVEAIRAKLLSDFGLLTHEKKENIERIAWKGDDGVVHGQRIDFVGYQIFHGWSRVRKRNFKYFRRCCLRCQSAVRETGTIPLPLAWRVESLSGPFLHTDSFRVLKEYFIPIDRIAKKVVRDASLAAQGA